MENKEIARNLKLCAQLMELHEENPFRVKSFTNASFQISRYAQPLAQMSDAELSTVPGVGKGLVPRLRELLDTGHMEVLSDFLAKTPVSVVQMLNIKGLGPSKVRTIWVEMGIESPGELLYACNENRLIEQKGFGEKTQAQVKSAIEFLFEHANKQLFAQVIDDARRLLDELRSLNPGVPCELVGDLAMDAPIVDKIEIAHAGASAFPERETGIDVTYHAVDPEHFEWECFLRTASPEHLKQLDLSGTKRLDEVYSRKGVSMIPASMREGMHEFEWAARYAASDLITDSELKGCLHNHSTYSDGIHTLKDMAEHLQRTGYKYFGISDHSKSAVYAGGLSEEEIEKQHLEIDGLNALMGPFRILKGIESDILPSGELDYSDDVLRTFDFVVASIHSAMKMSADQATARLVKAIEHPATKILGHPTGRLLLSRPGYPIHHQKVIDACAANGVDIELNANPMRLDIDWTWIHHCMERGVMISINPDAHRIEGFAHMHYGVLAARKGGLVKEMCLNALPLEALLARWATT